MREWQHASVWQWLLRPISWLFWLVVAARRYLYQAEILPSFLPAVPVVVVGNLSIGGTGKTPVVLALVDYLRRIGRAPGIVTRGYVLAGSGIHGAQEVRAASNGAPPDESGDEPQLLATRSAAPVYVSSRRANAVQALLADHANTNVVIGDDGLQHYALARDIEIVVVDGARGFGNGHLLPAGPLREMPSRLNTVDCIIVNNTNIDFDIKSVAQPAAHLCPAIAPALLASGKPVFNMTYGNETFLSLATSIVEQPAAMIERCSTRRVAAVAGIGHPQRFFDHIERLGLTLVSRHAFADHHAFVRADLDGIAADIILMTEKDAVKCTSFADSRMWAMQIDALLPEAFYDFILEKIDHVARPKIA